MADSTNANVPQAGGQLSGDTARAAAIRRLKHLEQQQATVATGPPR